MASLTQTVTRPVDRHDYNGIARVTPKADRANVKIAFNTWIANTYIPAAANAKVITSITAAAAGNVTSIGHGFSNGNQVLITGTLGTKSINGHSFTVGNVTANTFTISANTANTSTYGSYLTGGAVFVNPTGFTSTGLSYS